MKESINKDKIYFITTLRHDSIFGDYWCMFWAENGYTADVRSANRFSLHETEKLCDFSDLAIPIKILPDEINTKRNPRFITKMMIEKGTMNDLLRENGLKEIYYQKER